jgi:tyrosyl-tRNA synthetase
VGKHITVNYMISKESVRKRIEGETGISYTEFAYQLMQGYDFYWLYVNKGCKLQMGGSDQWGNITTGAELIRRKAGGEAFALTCPLVTKADGGKFGKTEKGNVWLDPARTSPYQFYQFWLNAADDDAERWIRLFTLLGRDEVESLIDTHRKDPGARLLQKALAREVTTFVHGRGEYEAALQTTESLFKGDGTGMGALSIEAILGALEGVPTHRMNKADIEAGMDVTTFLAQSGIFASKGEARRTIQGGGVSINRVRIEDPASQVDLGLLLEGRYILVQKGKKNYYLVVAE